MVQHQITQVCVYGFTILVPYPGVPYRAPRCRSCRVTRCLPPSSSAQPGSKKARCSREAKEAYQAYRPTLLRNADRSPFSARGVQLQLPFRVFTVPYMQAPPSTA